MRWLLAGFLMLCLSDCALAADEAEVQRLHALLNALTQEQESTYRQFQIVQEMRRTNAQVMCEGHLLPPGVVEYSDWIKAQQLAVQHESELQSQMEQINTRWNELEDEKKPILRRIYELSAPK